MKIRPCLFKKVCSLLFFATAIQFSILAQDDLKIEIKQIDAQKALIIKADVPTSEVGPKMGELYGKLFGYLSQNRIEPVGPPFAYYISYDPQGNTVFEAGVPVMQELTVEGEMVYKVYPETKAVSVLYTGPYEMMEPVYTKLMNYMKENNLKDKGVSCEVYLTDPAEEPDPKNYKTIVYFPVE